MNISPVSENIGNQSSPNAPRTPTKPNSSEATVHISQYHLTSATSHPMVAPAPLPAPMTSYSLPYGTYPYPMFPYFPPMYYPQQYSGRADVSSPLVQVPLSLFQHLAPLAAPTLLSSTVIPVQPQGLPTPSVPPAPAAPATSSNSTTEVVNTLIVNPPRDVGTHSQAFPSTHTHAPSSATSVASASAIPEQASVVANVVPHPPVSVSHPSMSAPHPFSHYPHPFHPQLYPMSTALGLTNAPLTSAHSHAFPTPNMSLSAQPFASNANSALYPPPNTHTQPAQGPTLHVETTTGAPLSLSRTSSAGNGGIGDAKAFTATTNVVSGMSSGIDGGTVASTLTAHTHAHAHPQPHHAHPHLHAHAHLQAHAQMQAQAQARGYALTYPFPPPSHAPPLHHHLSLQGLAVPQAIHTTSGSSVASLGPSTMATRSTLQEAPPLEPISPTEATRSSTSTSTGTGTGVLSGTGSFPSGAVSPPYPSGFQTPPRVFAFSHPHTNNNNNNASTNNTSTIAGVSLPQPPPAPSSSHITSPSATASYLSSPVPPPPPPLTHAPPTPQSLSSSAAGVTAGATGTGTGVFAYAPPSRSSSLPNSTCSSPTRVTHIHLPPPPPPPPRFLLQPPQNATQHITPHTTLPSPRPANTAHPSTVSSTVNSLSDVHSSNTTHTADPAPTAPTTAPNTPSSSTATSQSPYTFSVAHASSAPASLTSPPISTATHPPTSSVTPNSALAVCAAPRPGLTTSSKRRLRKKRAMLRYLAQEHPKRLRTDASGQHVGAGIGSSSGSSGAVGVDVDAETTLAQESDVSDEETVQIEMAGTYPAYAPLNSQPHMPDTDTHPETDTYTNAHTHTGVDTQPDASAGMGAGVGAGNAGVGTDATASVWFPVGGVVAGHAIMLLGGRRAVVTVERGIVSQYIDAVPLYNFTHGCMRAELASTTATEHTAVPGPMPASNDADVSHASITSNTSAVYATSAASGMSDMANVSGVDTPGVSGVSAEYTSPVLSFKSEDAAREEQAETLATTSVTIVQHPPPPAPSPRFTNSYYFSTDRFKRTSTETENAAHSFEEEEGD